MHQPVLVNEVLRIFNPQANQNYIDATFGFGGHSLKILEKTSPHGRILAIEWDPEVLNLAKNYIMQKFPHYQKRIIFKNANYREIKKIVKEEKFYDFAGIIFDLGVSSYHLEKSKRGFSFQKNEILDMRFNPQIKIKASDILNNLDSKILSEFLKTFEIKQPKKIAQILLKARRFKKFQRTTDIVKLFSSKKTLRLIFQALRVLVNNEMENIYKGIKESIDILKPNAKIIVITYQGLENKIVKKIIKEKKEKIKVIAKIKPTFKEIKKNPRARSAQLIALTKHEKPQIN